MGRVVELKQLGGFPNPKAHGRHFLCPRVRDDRKLITWTALAHGSQFKREKPSSNSCKPIQSDMAVFYVQLIIEGTVPNVGQALRDCDVFQRTASEKSAVSNGCHTLRDTDARQRSATCKGTLLNGRHRLGESDTCQSLAICKGKSFDAGDRLAAVFEGSSRNFRERGRDVDLQEALFMDCLFCRGFNFVSRVNDGHFRFPMQQPRRLQCLIIIYLTIRRPGHLL